MVLCALAAMCFASANEPPPYGVLPSPRQLAWHKTEFYALIHSGLNEIYDKEWAYGDESFEPYNPKDFDADHIVDVMKSAGMKGIVLVAKHHGGFCLWPSKYTAYSVKSTKWRDGKGDLVGEMAKACKKAGLKFGVYLSPWDRNHAEYGRPAYVDYYRNQLKELLTQYGPLFMVWFDGANGGDGYYGGARETRTIDRSTYYGWDTTWQMVRDLQPNACMFSDVGPDVRWVGNESGFAGETCWATYTPVGGSRPSKPGPGDTKYELGIEGTQNGKLWIPAECDTPLRPGWFWHKSQDGKARTPAQLRDVYFQSVGRGASLNLGLVINTDGKMPEDDEKKLRAFGAYLNGTFANNLARGAKVTAASTVWPGSAIGSLVDVKADTAWCSADGDEHPWIEIDLGGDKAFDVVELREKIALGQRVAGWAVDAWQDGGWREIAQGTTIGNRRLVRIPQTTAGKVRLRITSTMAPVALVDFGLYREATP